MLLLVGIRAESHLCGSINAPQPLKPASARGCLASSERRAAAPWGAVGKTAPRRGLTLTHRSSVSTNFERERRRELDMGVACPEGMEDPRTGEVWRRLGPHQRVFGADVVRKRRRFGEEVEEKGGRGGLGGGGRGKGVGGARNSHRKLSSGGLRRCPLQPTQACRQPAR